MRIDHIGLWCTDLESMRAFYESYFAAQASQRYINPNTQFQSYFLTFTSGARLELMQRPDIDPGQWNKEEAAQPFHLAISLGSPHQVDQLTAALQSAGYRVLSPPRTTGDGYYESVIADPEGNQIELAV